MKFKATPRANLASQMGTGSAPALGCSFPRPRGKPAWHAIVRNFHAVGAEPEAGCEGASRDTRGRVCSPLVAVRATTPARPTRLRPEGRAPRHNSAFTLAEVLAALVFMAIVIPVAVQGLRIASLAGQVGERKTTAARLATRVINEILVTGQWKESAPGGTLLDGPYEYRWRATSETWTENALRLISVQVQFNIQGQPYDITLATLADTSQP